jgi:hypothetical protein
MGMEKSNGLSLRELLTLKQIRLTGRTTDRTTALQLLSDNMIMVSEDGCLQLTTIGRRMLLRGSPLLWDLAS